MTFEDRQKDVPSEISFQPLIDSLWVVAVRLCISVTALISVTACTFFGTDETAAIVSFLFTPVAILFCLNAASAIWLRYYKQSSWFVLIHILLDIHLVTGVIYVTGGSASPFVFLYLLLVMVASALISRAAGLVTTLVSSLAHTSLILALVNGYIPPADGISTIADQTFTIVIQCIGLLSGMTLVAIGTSFLRNRLALSYSLVSESQKNLLALSEEQDRLLDEYPGGVITTDLELLIKNINSAARSILMIEQLSASETNLTSIIKFPRSFPCTPQEWLAQEDSLFDLTVENTTFGGEDRRLQVACRPLRNGIGIITGIAFFLHDVTQLRTAEEKLALQERMARLLADKQMSEPSTTQLGELIGESPLMQKVFDLIQRVSPTDATVLITGESGTGKELVARAIHFNSPRTNRPFVAVNCGAIPETLIESELFGHKKGAFTGAESDSLGLMRQAQGGTLFLDEIGELPLLMQAKILRCLQEKSVRPVGGVTDIPVDVRIVAATNRQLRKDVQVGKFREDLYYRLNVIGIHLPPLRERREDIPLLMNTILNRSSAGRGTKAISPAAMECLATYEYPGNVRELENILERASVLGGDVILPEHLPDTLHAHSSPSATRSTNRHTEVIEDPNLLLPIDLDQILASMERKYLEMALVKTHGAKKKAAGLLGLNFRSFRYRLQKFGLADDAPVEN